MASILKVDTIQDQSGNNIINESADTITIGASGDTVNIVGTLQNNGSAFAQGITEADQWRLNANSNTGSNAFVTANWERNDTSGFSKIGTGLSESSGVFSFASTGIYLITFYAQFEMEAGDGAAEFIMHKTTDNSTYAEAALALAGNDATSGGAVGTAANSFMFDVTDTSTHKFKFKTGSMGGTTFLAGRTDYNATGFTMTRLGDT